jgi:cell division transport system permease protein
MSKVLAGVRDFVVGDRQADQVVPPTGITSRLTGFVAAAMAFLTVFALALSLAAGRLADRWGEDLAQSTTLRINAPAGEMETQTAAALRVLDTTSGVASARALTVEEQKALLSPWLGEDLPLDALPVPQLIEILAEDDGYDAAGLRLRLAAEAPGAVLDDHSRWRAPLMAAATRLNGLGWIAIALIALMMAAMITLAANAALAASERVIRVLRLVGAKDRYIVLAFVRRFTIRALVGAFIGTVLGMIAVALLPAASDEGGFLTGLGFQGWHWGLPVLIPIIGAVVAYGATRAAARRTLARMA